MLGTRFNMSLVNNFKKIKQTMKIKQEYFNYIMKNMKGLLTLRKKLSASNMIKEFKNLYKFLYQYFNPLKLEQNRSPI